MRRKNVYKNRIRIEEREEMMAWLSQKKSYPREKWREVGHYFILIWAFTEHGTMEVTTYVCTFRNAQFCFFPHGFGANSYQTSESVWLWGKCGTSTSRLFPGYRSLVYN